MKTMRALRFEKYGPPSSLSVFSSAWGCRFFEPPLPGPPAILGAFLAVAMATGYTLTDKLLTARTRAEAPRVSALVTREPTKK
jgi:XapX domain-containing protein